MTMNMYDRWMDMEIERRIAEEDEAARLEENEEVIRKCKKCGSEIHLTKEESDLVGLRCPNCNKVIQ